MVSEDGCVLSCSLLEVYLAGGDSENYVIATHSQLTELHHFTVGSFFSPYSDLSRSSSALPLFSHVLIN